MSGLTSVSAGRGVGAPPLPHRSTAASRYLALSVPEGVLRSSLPVKAAPLSTEDRNAAS